MTHDDAVGRAGGQEQDERPETAVGRRGGRQEGLRGRHADALTDSWKQTKIENLALLLKAAIEAQGRVGLMLNVRRDDLAGVLALLPALQRPTIPGLSDDEWVAVNTMAFEERTVRDLIPKLKLRARRESCSTR